MRRGLSDRSLVCSQRNSSICSRALQNGTAILQHLKKMQPSAAGTQMRIFSGGVMRPPTVSAANSQHPSSPSQPLPPSQSQSMQLQSNAVSPIINHSPLLHPQYPVSQHAAPNGVSRAAISMPHVKVAKADTITTPALPNGVVNGVTTSPQPEANGDHSTTARPKSQKALLGLPQMGTIL